MEMHGMKNTPILKPSYRKHIGVDGRRAGKFRAWIPSLANFGAQCRIEIDLSYNFLRSVVNQALVAPAISAVVQPFSAA
jgi:hypothetical protein